MISTSESVKEFWQFFETVRLTVQIAIGLIITFSYLNVNKKKLDTHIVMFF